MNGIARVAARLLWANPGRLIVLVAGAISVALATSGIVLAATTSLAVVRQTVDAGWRGAYDLLVRPADAPSLSVDGRDVVPLDYLGLRTSGITREEWQRIAQLANVEVAAPVAALGWLKNGAPDVGVEFVDLEPGVVYAIEMTTTIAGQNAVHASALYAAMPAGQAPFAIGVREVIGDATSPDGAFVSFGATPPTWGLVVGIDPAAEDALIGLSEYVDGAYLTSSITDVFDPTFGRKAVSVPLLTAARSSIPGDLTVTVSALGGMTPDQVTAAMKAAPPQSLEDLQQVIDRLVASASPQRVNGDTTALGSLLHPLRQGAITLGPDGHLTSPEGEVSGFEIDDNVVLVASLAGYEPSSVDGANLILRPRGSWQALVDPELDQAKDPMWVRPDVTFGGDATVFRDLHVTVPPAFLLRPLTPGGTYDREAIDRLFGEASNAAPLGIYSQSLRALVSDAEPQSAARPLPVSINPAGLNPQAPIGLTNLEAVEALRGEHFIDAVRVRVAGISGYSPDAIRRIEIVTQQIVETTGLHVDVIAGSSPLDLRVAVPGLGVMSERWTTLGTAADIVSGAEGLSAGLLGAALLVVVGYLAAFGMFLTGDQAGEIEILRRVGWRRRAVIGLVATQAVALGAFAAVLTAGLVVALAATAGQRIDAALLGGAAILVFAAHPAAAWLASATRLGRRGASRRRASVPSSTGRIRGGIVGLAVAFAAEAPGRTIVAGVATALALTVAGVVAAIELAAGGELRTTLLGTVVAVRLAQYHFLAAAAALFAAGALVLDGALLTVERRLSLIGALSAVGWRSRAIRTLVTLETAMPAFLAGLIAAILVAVVGIWLELGILTLALTVGVFALSALLAVAATQLPAGVAVRAAPAATLRGQGASGALGSFAPRQALLTVGALVLIISLVAGGWGAAEGAAIAPLPFVHPTEHPISAAAVRIREDVTAISAFPDRAPGSSSFEGALAHISGTLAALGFTVQSVPYLSPQPDYFDAHGAATKPAGVFLPALAYDSAAWDGHGLDLPATFFDATANLLPDRCPTGIVVLRVDGYAGVPLAQQLQGRCLGRTDAVLAVRTADAEAWTALSGQVARIRLPAGRFLSASRTGDAHASPGPWLVVALDSTGPGASQSAASAAVMLEVARKAVDQRLALRIVVVGSKDGAAASVVPQLLVAEPAGPIMWLGAMGGSVAPVLGTTELPAQDRAYETAGLLWIAPVSEGFAQWVARASVPSEEPTSDRLLEVLSRTTGLPSGNEQNLNVGALNAGLDAAWLGEASSAGAGGQSIAGTQTDTVAQIHPRDLEQLGLAIIAALREFAGGGTT